MFSANQDGLRLDLIQAYTPVSNPEQLNSFYGWGWDPSSPSITPTIS